LLIDARGIFMLHSLLVIWLLKLIKKQQFIYCQLLSHKYTKPALFYKFFPHSFLRG